MNTLILAAEGQEALAVRQALDLHQPLQGPWAMHHGAGVVLLETGVGKVAAAAAVAYAQQRFNPQQAIWVGVAGALDPTLRALDVLIARDSVQYDVDITAFGRAMGELATGERYVSANARLSQGLYQAAKDLGFPVQIGRIASADRFLANPAHAAAVREAFAADAVEMEGAAALWVAKKLKLPMALLRTVTDAAGSEAPMAFETFLPLASQRLGQILQRFLHSVTT